MHNVITAGSASEDLFIHVDDIIYQHKPLIDGQKYEAQQLVRALGGGALNTAHTLHTLGIKTHPWCIQGDDCTGMWMRDAIKKAGLPSTYISTTSQASSAQSFILPSPTGNRPILAYRGCTELLQIAGLHTHLEGITGLYLCSLPLHCTADIPALIRVAHKQSIKTGTNPGIHQLKDRAYAQHLLILLNVLDMCIMNEVELQAFIQTLVTHKLVNLTAQHPTKDKKDRIEIEGTIYSIADVYTALAPHLTGWFITTCGAQGAYACTEGTLYYCPPAPAHVISSVGAGDTFGATVFEHLLRETTLEEALISASLHSARVLEHVGAFKGHTSQKELNALATHHSIRIQKYPLDL